MTMAGCPAILLPAQTDAVGPCVEKVDVLRSFAVVAFAALLNVGAQAQTPAELRTAVASLPLNDDDSCIVVVLPGAGTPASADEVKRLRPLILKAVRTEAASAVQVPAPKGADAGELLTLLKESGAEAMVVASVFAAADGSDVVLQLVSAEGKVLGSANVGRARRPPPDQEKKSIPPAERPEPADAKEPPAEPAPPDPDGQVPQRTPQPAVSAYEEADTSDGSSTAKFKRDALRWTAKSGAVNEKGVPVGLQWLADRVEDERLEEAAADHARNSTWRGIINRLTAVSVMVNCACIPTLGFLGGLGVGVVAALAMSNLGLAGDALPGFALGGGVCCFLNAAALAGALGTALGSLVGSALFPVEVKPGSTRRAVHSFNTLLAKKYGSPDICVGGKMVIISVPSSPVQYPTRCNRA